MEMKTNKVYTITFTEEEFDLFMSGIGNTSVASRENAGMETDQAEFFNTLYNCIRYTSVR